MTEGLDQCDGRCHLDEGQKSCGVWQTEGIPFVCTLPKGHDGAHVACNGRECDVATWEGGEKPPASGLGPIKRDWMEGG